MTDEHALLAAIAADPADDTVRLAYADYVEESGDPERAEFIRNQVVLARVDSNALTRRALVVRNVKFLRESVPRWRAEMPRIPGITWGDFERGLVEEVQAETADAIVRNAAAIFSEPAIHVIRLARLPSARGLAAMSELSRVRTLGMIGARAGPEVLRDLFASKYLSNLAILDLHGNLAGDPSMVALVAAAMPALIELWLGSNVVGNVGGQALADSPHLQNVRLLDLRGNRITDPAVRSALSRRFKSGVKL